MRRLLTIAAAGLVAFVVGICIVSYLRREREATTPLARAAQAGDAASLKSLVAGGADVNARDAEGHTPLAYAARAGDVASIKSLLDAGADPNTRDCESWKWTPLIHALHKYQNDAARLLVERGADVNGRAGDCAANRIESGVTPLMIAAKFDNAAMVKFLLEHGADARAEYDGYNALSYAVAGGSLGRLSDIDRAATHPCAVETVKELLKAAPGLKPGDRLVDRAVMYVAKKKCPEVARLLDGRQPPPAPEGHASQAAADAKAAHN